MSGAFYKEICNLTAEPCSIIEAKEVITHRARAGEKYCFLESDVSLEKWLKDEGFTVHMVAALYENIIKVQWD